MLLEKIYEKNHLCIKFLNIKFKFNLEHLKQLYKKSKNYKNYFVVLKERKKQEKFLKEHLNFINIETFSKCNRQCWFCTNSIIDRHSKNIRMKESLYKKIIDDLAKIKYCGAITYSYYNEPLLDDIIIDRIRYARKKLPNAFLFTHTNGDYINEDYVTLKYVIPILRFFNFKSEFFICDDFVKKGSYWANASDLKVVVNKGHHLQYHSKTHKDLTLFSDERILGNEIITPYYLKTLDFGGFEYFAYPCWKYNPLIKSVVSKFYKGGLSGNGFSDYTIWAMDGIRVSNNFSFIKKIF